MADHMDAPRFLRIALAQFNSTVGDVNGNAERMIEWIARARDDSCDLIVFPELAVTGYPPEDLLLSPAFIRDNRFAAKRVAAASHGIGVVFGFVDLDGDIFNAAAVAHGGAIKDTYHKVFLPNYGVFDEDRYFRRGQRCPLFQLGGVRFGVSICEDCWYPSGPMSIQAQHGADVLININGSPFHAGKSDSRQTMLATRAMDSRAFVAWVNLVGGQDELVFDGNSMILDPGGELIAHAQSFQEQLLIADLDIGAVLTNRLRDTRLRKEFHNTASNGLRTYDVVITEDRLLERSDVRPGSIAPRLIGPAEVYTALVVGTHDYVTKTGFKKVVIGLSGGIDSALTAAIAADALGRDNAVGVLLPSRFTSAESLEDGALVAENLGIQTLEIPIESIQRGFEDALAETFSGTSPGIAEENLQARIRGNLLMALSNKFGWLVLTTGNKSEVSTGYCTLYGDMAGGFAVLKDIPKTLVYELCRYRNSIGSPVIPQRVLTKAPSAELRPNQKDEDSLPPYGQLDPILRDYVENDRSFEELVARGNEASIVRKVIQLVDRSEYKRRQAAPGVKITPRAFGRDRRMPIVNQYDQALKRT